MVAIFGVQGWRWDWVRGVRELVFALDADAAGQHQWQALARQAALWGKRVAVLEPSAYGGHKDVSEAWAAGPGQQRQPLEARCSLCLSTSENPGLSGLRSWSWTAASRARKPSAWRGIGSRPQAQRREVHAAATAHTLRVTVCSSAVPP